MQTIAIQNAKNLLVHGRISSASAPLTLFWTGSGLEFDFKGTELWVEFETDYESFEQWISVMVNGTHIARLMLPKGRAWLPLLRGFDPTQINRIEILKDVQAMPNDESAKLQIHALKLEGEILPIAQKNLKLEVIGDSITSGEGAIGAPEETAWIPMWFCAAHSYGYLTGKLLDADTRILSQSGWGALTSWDNDPHCALPLYYEQVCGVLKGEKNAALGAKEKNDFKAWNADVIVCNLGTNDGSAFFQPAWTDPETGIAYKQRSVDGIPVEEDIQKLKAAMIEFLVKLRKNNPHAHILWAYGMLGTPMQKVIEEAVEQYKAQYGDEKASFFQLPEMQPDGIGARSHPGLLTHQRAAEALAVKIRSLL